MQGRTECILVNPVEQGPLLLGRHAARDGRHWYFSDGRNLCRVPREVLRAPGASLSRAERLSTPPGAFQGLLAFRDWLLLGLRREGSAETTLFASRSGEGWTETGTLAGRIGPWCLSPDGRAAFLVADPWDKRQPGTRDILASSDGRNWRVLDRLRPEEAGHVHGLTCHGRDLLVLVGDDHFRHLRLPALDHAGLPLPEGERPRQDLGLEHKSLHRTLPRPGGGLFFALDGATELYHPDGTVALRDDAPGECGFQVAAHACFPGAPDLLFFGTWRRNARAPYPCLYVLSPAGALKFVDRSRAFDESLAWTGYQDMDGTLIRPDGEERDERFWPCHCGQSLCLVPLDGPTAARLAADGVPRVAAASPGGLSLLAGLPAIIAPV